MSTIFWHIYNFVSYKVEFMEKIATVNPCKKMRPVGISNRANNTDFLLCNGQSRKSLSFLLRLGWRNFRSAFASI